MLNNFSKRQYNRVIPIKTELPKENWFFIIDDGKIKATIKTSFYDAQTKVENLLKNNKIGNDYKIISYSELNQEIKEITLINGSKVYISKMSYFVKSDYCKHSNKEYCEKCILFGSYIPKQVLNALDGQGALI